MRRNRGKIPEGYTRKTVSLPTALVEEIQHHLDTKPGDTMSMFLTDAARNQLGKRKA